MGNILVPQSTQQLWKKENINAERLLKLVPYNEKEKELIERTKSEQFYKNLASCLLGLALGLSLKRYFPNAQLVENNSLFSLTVSILIMPCFMYAKIMTNRDIIEVLSMIDENHEILEDRF